MERPAAFSLHPPVKLEPEDRRTLILVSLAFFVAGFDLNILGAVMPRMLADFGRPTEDAGMTITFIRIGVLAALVFSALSDRFGRRALLLFTVIGSAITTLATAFAQTSEQFIFFQGLVRAFGYAQDMISIVVVTEEMDERVRGWALGVLIAVGAAGAGAAALIFGFVEIIPGDWRGLYVIGAMPLVFIAFLWRNLKETKRFNHQASIPKPDRGMMDVVAPLIDMAKRDTARLLLIIGVVAPFAFGGTAAVVLFPTFLQEERGFTPPGISALVIGGGAFALLGNFLSGRMSDLWGRRTVFIGACLMFTLAWALFYTVATGWVLVAAWIVGIVCFFAMDVTSSAFGAELFRTAYRSTGSAIRMATSIVAGGIALMLHTFYVYGWFDQHGNSIAALLVFVPISAIIAWAFLPETAGRKLEDIAPEPGAKDA